MGFQGQLNTPARPLVEGALAGSGINVFASCSIEAYDARAPAALRSRVLLPGALGVIVVASAGRELWSAFRAYMREDPRRWELEHPLDAYVAHELSRADEALARAPVAFRRFEPTLYAQPALDFRALGEMVGLGSPGPFGLLIHREHGPWWALRGAYLVRANVDSPKPFAPPCAGCAAPCVGRAGLALSVAQATPEVRGRCVFGQASRYEDEQIAYHYEREATLAKLRAWLR